MLDMQSPAMKLLSSGGSSGVLGPSDVPPDNALIARDAWQMQRPGMYLSLTFHFPDVSG